MLRILFNSLIFIFFSTSAIAAEKLAPVKDELHFDASFSGINFGEIDISFEVEEKKADISCDISSSGIFALFLSHQSHSTLLASGKDFIYPNRVYESKYRTRKKERQVKITYENSKVTEETLIPPDNRAKRPAVPEEIKNSAYDLMSFLLQIRKEILAAKQNDSKKFTINSFDGRRVFQADFTISETTPEYIAVTSRRTQIAGFTKSEIEDFDPKEPSMTTYFSNDEKLIPIRMEVPFMFGTIRAELLKKE